MAIGIMLFETAGSRLLGDPGYPGTFDFPVEYGAVKGSYRDLIEGSGEALQRLTATARELERRGVKAIAGDCGLMALYQREIAAAVRIPVISSSLVLLPLIRSMISPEQAIGVLTGHSALLSGRHLAGAGAGQTERLAIQGMQDEPHFKQVVIEGEGEARHDRMLADVLRGVGKLKCACGESGMGELGAVLLECSNLAVFGAEVAKEFHIPVFDINTAVCLLESAWTKPEYGRRG